MVTKHRDMPLVALVVDDSMLIRHTIRRFLEARGMQVECATNGLRGLEALNRVSPDVIVTDLQMPEMSGPEFIAAVRQRHDTARVPIIVVAARQSRAELPVAHAEIVIYKDIDITEQLGRAVDVIGTRR